MRVVFDVVNVKTVLSRVLWYCHVPVCSFAIWAGSTAISYGSVLHM